ncbi:MAG: ATPase [Pseudomonadota bacterium]|nr:ATPase [Pseudomonadota bacterium]
MIEFLVGVDGGGTGTRALLAAPDGTRLGRGQAGPSALSQGIAGAWREIRIAVWAAFAAAGHRAPDDLSRCALGAGLSGVHHQPWKDAFIDAQPGFAALAVDTDAFTMLLGAHAGRPGSIVIAGTGSVAEVLRADGTRAVASGWGFPAGDEGSGAWLGLRAMAVAQAALDGRAPAGALARKVWDHCGGANREALLTWCAAASQTAYGRLAPAVFEAEADDPAAAHLVGRSICALEDMAHALDPAGDLPLALAGSIGQRLAPRLAAALQTRRTEPADGADVGALTLIRRTLDRATCS